MKEIIQLREELITYFCHLLPKSISITFDEKDIDNIISEHLKAIQVQAGVIKKNAGNILTEQARHYLGDCLNELKYSRPAWEQKLIHNWISEWNAQKVILLGDTWTAEDIIGGEE